MRFEKSRSGTSRRHVRTMFAIWVSAWACHATSRTRPISSALRSAASGAAMRSSVAKTMMFFACGR